jgi:hypothetical protein
MNKKTPKKASRKRLKQGVFLLLATISTWWFQQLPAASSKLEQVIKQQQSDVVVEFKGKVIKLLADDNKGSRHQKFIVRNNLHTILIAHNIDLSPRVPISVGDELFIRGEYEWNEKGGVVHWTHADPNGTHEGGWIRFQDKVYQ